MTRIVSLSLAVLAAVALAACGSSSSASSSTTGGPARGGPGRLFSAKVRACLKQQGVTLPGGARGNRRGTRPARPQGGRPGGGFGRRGGGFGTAKVRKALKACGVSFPSRPGGGPPGGGQGGAPAPQGQAPPQS